MKHFLTITLMLFFALSSYATKTNLDQVKDTKVKTELINYKVEILNIQTNMDYSCTLSFKVYIPTQSGIVGFGMSITADTCDEASAGISDAIAGFMSEIQ